jgi:hypothetical protein
MRHVPTTDRSRRRPAALRDGAGPWRDDLELAAAIERHDRHADAH